MGWILSGNPANWRIALQRNITRPVSGLIGTGKVTRKMEESTPYWPDEEQLGRAIYPYRIEFKPTKLLEESTWENQRVSISHLGPIYFGGINPIRSRDLLTQLNMLFEKSK